MRELVDPHTFERAHAARAPIVVCDKPTSKVTLHAQTRRRCPYLTVERFTTKVVKGQRGNGSYWELDHLSEADEQWGDRLSLCGTCGDAHRSFPQTASIGGRAPRPAHAVAATGAVDPTAARGARRFTAARSVRAFSVPA